MYVTINKDYFDKNKEKAAKEWTETSGSNENWEFNELAGEIENIEVYSDEMTIDVSSELGYVSITVPLSSVLVENVINAVIKQMNKYKTLLESLK